MSTTDNYNPNEYASLKISESFSLIKWVVKFVYSITPGYATVFFFSSIVTSLYAVANTYVLTRIMDVLIEILQETGTTLTDIYPYMAALLAIALIETIFSFMREYSSRGLDMRARPLMDKFLYEKLNSLGIQTLEQPKVNDMINRTRRELGQIVDTFYKVIEVAVSLGSLIVSSVIIFTSVPWAIPLIAIFSFPKYLTDKKYRSELWRFSYENTEKNRAGHMNSYYLGEKEYIQEISLSGAYTFFDKRFTEFINWLVGERMRLIKKWFGSSHAFGFLTDLGLYVAYLMTFAKFLVSKISVGDVFFQIRMIDSLSREISHFTSRFNSLFESSIRVKDVYKLFIMTPAFPDGEIEMPVLKNGPSVEFKNLTFKYPNTDRTVLDNINLNIKPGEKVAIVGHNGAGKTTLVRLVVRLYLPHSGSILIDGKDSRSLKIDSLHKNMGVLFQDFNKYHSLVLRDNVVVGKSDIPVDEERFVDALDRADALEFANELDNKFEQILSEKYTGGIRLSAGQWQKLAIARFFYRNAPLVIFDEPTAAIDAVSEYNIFNKIYSFFAGKTVIIISHRFSTVRNADRIIVLEKGRIIEEGSHQQLIEKNGYYAESFRLQAEGYSIV